MRLRGLVRVQVVNAETVRVSSFIYTLVDARARVESTCGDTRRRAGRCSLRCCNHDLMISFLLFPMHCNLITSRPHTTICGHSADKFARVRVTWHMSSNCYPLQSQPLIRPLCLSLLHAFSLQSKVPSYGVLKKGSLQYSLL